MPGVAERSLMVGTDKGLFRLSSLEGDVRFDGPYLPGQRVLHVTTTPDRPNELHAAVDHPVWGSHVHVSVDGGETWASLAAMPHHPPGRHASAVDSIWHLAWSPDGRTLYAGIAPAGLFASDDRGASWRDVVSLNEHATCTAWEPSRGLFALHSICIDRGDPARLVVGVSAGGVYRTHDAAVTWEASNVGVRAEQLPDRYPVAGHNVHRVVMHPLDGRRLYRQCYNGTYRSDDGAATWTEITAGLPSDFGYAVVCDPTNPDVVLQIPESSSHMRATVDGRLRVYRSDDAGRSWRSVSAGLPQRHVYVTVLRDAMEADPLVPGRIAFGTSSGHVFQSHDLGEHWSLVAEFLPRVLCLRYCDGAAPRG